MKILVCIKAVPDFEQHGLDPDWPFQQSDAPLRMNAFDAYAVETAIRLKSEIPDTVVDAVTLGPADAAGAIKRAAGMGADNGIHILAETAPIHDPAAIACAIANVAGQNHYDLIIAGVMSEDLMQMAVGPMIAGRLDLPCATAAVRLTHDPEENRLYVERELEGGEREMLTIGLPAVITVQTGIYTPRYPSLSNMLRANRMPIETIPAESVLPAALTQEIFAIDEPEKTRAGRVLEGTGGEKADQLIAILRQNALLP